MSGQGSGSSIDFARPIVDRSWLDKRHEDVIEPDLPIVDPHHHLWDRPGDRYLFSEFLEDLQSGHNIEATVFVQCAAMYRQDGPPELRPVGETEFVNGIAAMFASGAYGPVRACAGIVGYADLMLGSRVQAVLEAHINAAGGRFRGIRNVSAWHPSDEVRSTIYSPPHDMLLDRKFRDGFACLGALGLSFDAFLYHTQLADLADLAGAFPDTTIILDHVGGVIGIGPYANKRDEVFADWRKGIEDLARQPNVHVKLGGLGMKLSGFGFAAGESPPSSTDLAEAWRPYIETCISAFGPERCMFESNFPVDKASCSYAVLWNAFKRLAAGYSDREKAYLFSKTASSVYRLTGNGG